MVAGGTREGAPPRSYQRKYERKQLPPAPEHKDDDRQDKYARGYKLTSGMRGRGKVKAIIGSDKTIEHFVRGYGGCGNGHA